MSKIQIKKTDKGSIRFVLKAGNGQVILVSHLYSSVHGCENGIESVKKNSQDDINFKRKLTKSGFHFFTLNATNGQVVGKSEMYSSKDAMENGIASVKKNAPNALIIDS